MFILITEYLHILVCYIYAASFCDNVSQFRASPFALVLTEF
jgi:hypothetical protein